MADGRSNFEQKNSRRSNSNSDSTNQKSRVNSSSNERVVIPKALTKILESAREFLSRKEYGKALSHFAYVVHSSPLLSDQVHDDFLFALKNWGSVLAENGKLEDLVKCLEQACKLFPNSAEIANNVGSTLFRLNLFDEAAVYFRQALKLDPQLSSAEENLDSIANVLVERWHFRMLNDKERNQAYKNAIDRAVKSGCGQALDIGSGTCILSMFAVQSGAKEVYACEMSKTMYDLSLDILSANQMRDSVHVINKKSHDLTTPGDLPGQVSLIITETLDCGLLGEGIIETLTHAKRQLLAANQKAQIIPEGATVYGQLIECEKIRNYSQVKQAILADDVGSVQIRGAEVSEKGEEPYTTEEMSCIDHVTLSDPFHIMTYDFQTPENYMKEFKHDLNVSIVRSGHSDAIMVWFELRLDANETLSSAPGRSVCWEQAVYPCRLLEGKQTVKASDEVMLNVQLTSSAIFLEVAGVTSCRAIQPSPEVDSSLSSEELSKLNNVKLPVGENGHVNALEVSSAKQNQAVSSICKHSKELDHLNLEVNGTARVQNVEPFPKVNIERITLPYQDISKLNDVDFTESCNEALSDAFEKLKLSSTNDSILGCIVLCSSLTFSPLFALRSGFSPVVCITNDTSFMQCLKTLADERECSESLCFMDKPLETLAGSEGWGVLIVDPVEPSGQLRQGVVEDIVLAKGCVLPKDAGIVLPRKIEVWGMLISSTSLCQKSHVISDDVTLGLSIAGHFLVILYLKIKWSNHRVKFIPREHAIYSRITLYIIIRGYKFHFILP